MTSPQELSQFYRRDQDIRETEQRLARLKQHRVNPPPFSGGSPAAGASPGAVPPPSPLRSAHPTTADLYNNSPNPNTLGTPSYVAVPPPQLASILTDARGNPIGGGGLPSSHPFAAAADQNTAAPPPRQPSPQQQRQEQDAAVAAAISGAQPGATGPLSAPAAHLASRARPSQQQQQQQQGGAGPAIANTQDMQSISEAGLLFGQNHKSNAQDLPEQGKKPELTAAPSGLSQQQEQTLISTSNICIGDPMLARRAVSSPIFSGGSGSGLSGSGSGSGSGGFENPDAAAIAAAIAADNMDALDDYSGGGDLADVGKQPSLAIDPDSHLEVPDVPSAPSPPMAVLQQLDKSTRPDRISTAWIGSAPVAVGTASPMPNMFGADQNNVQSCQLTAVGVGAGAQQQQNIQAAADAVSSPKLPQPVGLSVVADSTTPRENPAQATANFNQMRQQQAATMLTEEQQQQLPEQQAIMKMNNGNRAPVVPPIALGQLSPPAPAAVGVSSSSGSPQITQQEQQQKDRLTKAMEAAMGFGGGSQAPSSSNPNSSRGDSQPFNFDDMAANTFNQNDITQSFGDGGRGVPSRKPQQQQQQQQDPAGIAAPPGGFHYSMGQLNAGQPNQPAQMLPGAQPTHSLGDVMAKIRSDQPSQQQQHSAVADSAAEFRRATSQQQQPTQPSLATGGNYAPDPDAVEQDVIRRGAENGQEQLMQRSPSQQQQQNRSLSNAQQQQQQQQLRLEEAEYDGLAHKYGQSSPGRMMRRLHESERMRLALVREVESLKEDLKEAAEQINSKFGKPSSSVARNARSAGAQSFDPNGMNENVVVRVRSTDAMEGHGAQWAAEIDEEDQARTRAQQVMGEMLRAIDARKAAEVRLQQISLENQRLREQAKQAHDREQALHKMLTQYQDAFNKWRATWVDKDMNSENGDHGASVLSGKSAGLSTVRVQILESRVEALTRENERLKSEMNVASARRKAEEDAEASRLALRGSGAASLLNVTSTKGAAALRRKGMDQETDVLVRMFELQRSNESLQHTVNEMKLQRR